MPIIIGSYCTLIAKPESFKCLIRLRGEIDHIFLWVNRVGTLGEHKKSLKNHSPPGGFITSLKSSKTSLRPICSEIDTVNLYSFCLRYDDFLFIYMSHLLRKALSSFPWKGAIENVFIIIYYYYNALSLACRKYTS